MVSSCLSSPLSELRSIPCHLSQLRSNIPKSFRLFRMRNERPQIRLRLSSPRWRVRAANGLVSCRHHLRYRSHTRAVEHLLRNRKEGAVTCQPCWALQVWSRINLFWDLIAIATGRIVKLRKRRINWQQSRSSVFLTRPLSEIHPPPPANVLFAISEVGGSRLHCPSSHLQSTVFLS